MTRYCLLIVLLVVGCTGTDSQRNDASHDVGVLDSPPTQGLVVEATTGTTVLARGETLHIKLTVTNEGDVDVVKHFASGCIYGFSLVNEQGETVAPPPPVCTMNAPTVRYAPGEEVTREFQWVWDDPDIEPGTYRLVAGLGPRGEQESAPSVEIHLE